MSPAVPATPTGGRGVVRHDTVRRSGDRLEADRRRVVTRLFVPGQEAFDHQDSRTTPVVERILALDEHDAGATYDDVVARFGDRHRDLEGTFRRHADEVRDRLDPGRPLSDRRRLLLGASFTCEYAIEGAALCNPSVVAHPDQRGLAPGVLRIVVSVRAIGEGHISSLGFRTGTVAADGHVAIDPSTPHATLGPVGPARLEADQFRVEARRLGLGADSIDFLLEPLGPTFTRVELESRLVELQGQSATRAHAARTIAALRRFADRTYVTTFDPRTVLGERVLWPAMSAESHGMEDARFVRLVDGDGSWTYVATYTAYDGADISQQLLRTDDFLTFSSTPLVGAAAMNKGLAFFPRKIGGRFAAMSRADRETNSVAFADTLGRWDQAVPCQAPRRPWEVLQLGNCGSPIETEAGWLVLTHGVGPMREYSIGAILLDLDDPTRLVASLAEPLLRPTPAEQDGYVPNVVYSCGSLVHAGMLVLPYGIGDAAIGFASVPVAEVLAALT